MHTSPASPLTEQKQGVPRDFDRVARRYDLLTGMNPGYRRHLRMSAERLRLASGAALAHTYPDAAITGLDASDGMLAVARGKPWAGRVRWLCGDAMDPAAAGADGPFDGVLMAYGIRNVPDADACLANLRALLAPGGAICFHEYSVADSARARLLWNLVAGAIIIPSGALTSPGSPIYRYLRRSVLDFDGVRAFEDRLRAAGFVDVRTEPMDGWQRGIVHSFLARRPA